MISGFSVNSSAICRAVKAGGWVWLMLAVLSCLPVLVAPYPQMGDYPAHLARYYVMIDGGHNPDLARYYSFRWQWTGNVGVDLLIGPFAAVFGLEPGARIITGLIPPLTGLAILAVEWVLRRRFGIGSLLAFVFIWSPMMLIGMLNFALGQALALWTFALWVWLEQRGRERWWHGPLFAAMGAVVWLCHMSAWGILVVLVLGYEWRRWRSLGAVFRPWPLALPFVFMVTAMVLHHGGTDSGFSYGSHWWRYKKLIWQYALRDTSYPLDTASAVIVVEAILAALGTRRIDRRLGWAATVLLILSVGLPRHISGGDYVDYRMITSGLMVGCLAIDLRLGRHRVIRNIILCAGMLLYLVRLGATTLSWSADSRETARMLQALNAIPQGSRVASAVLVSDGDWGLNHFEHIGAYAVLRRDALVNANFTVAHIHMLHLNVPYYSDPTHRLLLLSTQKVDLAHFAPAIAPWAGAQYLWYVGGREPDTLPPGARVIWRAPHTLVARLANSPEGH